MGFTWDDAAARFQELGTRRKPTTIKRENYMLRVLRPILSGLPIEQVRAPQIANVRVMGHRFGWHPRTVNYCLGVVRAVLRAAHEWEWITYLPRVRMEKCPRHRVRWLTFGEASALLLACRAQLRDMVEISLHTGLRQSSLCHMEWGWIDFNAKLLHVPGRYMKAGLPVAVPLDSAALRTLCRLRATGRHARWVWVWRGERLKRPCRKDFLAAMVDAGIEDFRWHDLRHTWASWHVQAGTPLAELQRLGGWETLEMVQRYAHLDAPRHSRAQRVCDAFEGGRLAA